MFMLVALSVVAVAYGGVIHHGGDEGGHGGATSYQHIQLESFHPVPIYVKKEHAPVHKGFISSDVQVHHGGYGGEHGEGLHGQELALGGHEGGEGLLAAGLGQEHHQNEGLEGHYEGEAQLQQQEHQYEGAALDGGHESAGLHEGYEGGHIDESAGLGAYSGGEEHEGYAQHHAAY